MKIQLFFVGKIVNVIIIFKQKYFISIYSNFEFDSLNIFYILCEIKKCKKNKYLLKNRVDIYFFLFLQLFDYFFL